MVGWRDPLGLTLPLPRGLGRVDLELEDPLEFCLAVVTSVGDSDNVVGVESATIAAEEGVVTSIWLVELSVVCRETVVESCAVVLSGRD